ncbi:hypothetical protein MITS9509_03492 [Synechococcus sp. MIT S9509]|uniref:hypothetical protein n=1 Tax=Synechococcus sp. MIT S9509 TaxID=1801630 RepID=UPI0007BB9186|nr:hypothetical protein [Synechococcus sp. MIT S9509]KZR86253.1 hypothetical protein MITS9509_03492 [Synechococcus sp. MIT S9509]
MTIENIDNVLEALVLAGGVKIDWDDVGDAGRSCPDGSWYVGTDIDTSWARDLEVAVQQRMDIIQINVDNDGQIGVIFDPVTRRIEAMEIGETDFGGLLLRMTFWPGLETARELYRSTMANWKQVLEDGWFEGDI